MHVLSSYPGLLWMIMQTFPGLLKPGRKMIQSPGNLWMQTARCGVHAGTLYVGETGHKRPTSCLLHAALCTCQVHFDSKHLRRLSVPHIVDM